MTMEWKLNYAERLHSSPLGNFETRLAHVVLLNEVFLGGSSETALHSAVLSVELGKGSSVCDNTSQERLAFLADSLQRLCLGTTTFSFPGTSFGLDLLIQRSATYLVMPLGRNGKKYHTFSAR